MQAPSIRQISTALILLAFSVISYGENDKNKTPAISPFSAVLVEYSSHNALLQKKSRIQMGEDGMRMIKLSSRKENPEFEYIQDFQGKKEWVAMPGKLYYAELPQVDDGPEEGEGASASVLNPEPCLDMDGEKVAEREIKGTRLTVWKCSSKDHDETYLQHFSSLLGVVVRQESSSGYTMELKEIRLEAQGTLVFAPSRLWRKVSLEEFFGDTPTLPRFREGS